VATSFKRMLLFTGRRYVGTGGHELYT